MYKKRSSCCSYECGTLCIASLHIFSLALGIPSTVYLLVMADEFINLPQFQEMDPEVKNAIGLYLKPVLSGLLTTFIIDMLIVILALVGISHKKPALMFPYLFRNFIGLFLSAIIITVMCLTQCPPLIILGNSILFAMSCYLTFVIYKCYKQIKYGKIVEEDKELMVVD